MTLPKSEVFNIDCMEGMKQYPDKYFELAIVDPPYGINADSNAYKNGINCKANGFKEYRKGMWDKGSPDIEYFKELFRVSKNQIIWGANHFIESINKNSSCWIIWNKVQRGFSFSDAELAWTSMATSVRVFDYARGNDSGFAPKLKDHERAGINIHPTQKPVALYRWLLANYAKQGDKILDTHLGSGSSRIAAHQLGFDFTGYELDKDYFEASEKRFRLVTSQKQIEF